MYNNEIDKILKYKLEITYFNNSENRFLDT